MVDRRPCAFDGRRDGRGNEVELRLDAGQCGFHRDHGLDFRRFGEQAGELVVTEERVRESLRHVSSGAIAMARRGGAWRGQRSTESAVCYCTHSLCHSTEGQPREHPEHGP